MSSKLLTTLAASLLAAATLPAANIAWVSPHPADLTPTAGAAGVGLLTASDIGYTALLRAQGHTVTRFTLIGDLQNSPTTIADLNTNDLVIISRASGSGAFDTAGETAAWNSSITKPLLSLGGYINRNNRLGFNTGDTIPDVNSATVRLRVLAPTHPIFEGLALNPTNLMLNGYAQRVSYTNASATVVAQRGISVVTSAIRPGGTVLATIGTPGDAAINGLVIAEFPAGMTTHRDVLAAKRMVFLTGSREHAAPPTSSGDLAGMYDLLPDGEQLFLKTVTYLTTPQVPRCTLALTSATNLVAGDTWTFDAGVIGDPPLTFQWYKDGTARPDGTTAALNFTSLTTADAGAYQLIVTNASGAATSTVGRLAFYVFPPTSITNGLMSYWPLDELQGSKAFDVVSTYDMNAANLNASHVVAGRFGNAFTFDNASQRLLSRIHGPNETLPIYQHPNFTISMWVQGGIQPDRRVFAEGNTTNATPMISIGTQNTGASGIVDVYVRNNAGTVIGDHRYSTATAFDFATWHHITYVQRDIGDGNMKAQLWVDGVLDPVVITPVRPLSANTTAIGGLLRSSPSSWFTGLMDEVAVWNRALSAEEIGILQTTAITNPPVRPQPLVINSFKADLSSLAAGGSTTLRWDTRRDVTAVSITPLGNQTANTVYGVGSVVVNPAASTTYVLTVTRGSETMSATTSVAVVTGVATGWNLLETFDQYALPILGANGIWNDATGGSGQIVTPNGNRAVRTATGNAMNFLNLRALTVPEGQARTLFFRAMAGATNAAGLTNIVGLTDKSMRSYGDSYVNIGPVLYFAAFTNSLLAEVTTNAWYLGTRNGWLGNNTSTDVEYATNILEAGVVYNIWVDITNAPLGEFADDTFSVSIAREGSAERTVLFTDRRSDRDPYYIEAVLGGMLPTLDKLIVLGNNATHSAIFDDFYLTATGYLTTVPRAYGYTGPLPGPLSLDWLGGQLQIQWTNGTLQHAPTVEGPWTDVPGNPASPYSVAPTGGATFYRSRL